MNARSTGIWIHALLLLCLSIGAASYASTPADTFGFPETWDRIAIFADSLPYDMTDAQIRFAATHYVGTQKLPLSLTRKLRAVHPKFIVIHYHLAIWQSNPKVSFIIDGQHWGNDYSFVSKHRNWFWLNAEGHRVQSSDDGKYLMNISNPDFQKYWISSLIQQMKDGMYQGVFLDSASVDLLQGWCGKADPRLAGTAAYHHPFKELGGKTWSQAYEAFMSHVSESLEKAGYAAIPNLGNLYTGWDKTDYYDTSSGAFLESAFMTHSPSDWRMGAERLIRITSQNKITLLQPYLDREDDAKQRMYYIACYLLFKGRHTYIDYFGGGHRQEILSWYPEYDLDLGAPMESISNLSQLSTPEGVYMRRYERGLAIVNPTDDPVNVSFPATYWNATPNGGGMVPANGEPSGNMLYQPVAHLTVPPWSGAVLLYKQ